MSSKTFDLREHCWTCDTEFNVTAIEGRNLFTCPNCGEDLIRNYYWEVGDDLA